MLIARESVRFEKACMNGGQWTIFAIGDREADEGLVELHRQLRIICRRRLKRSEHRLDAHGIAAIREDRGHAAKG